MERSVNILSVTLDALPFPCMILPKMFLAPLSWPFFIPYYFSAHDLTHFLSLPWESSGRILPMTLSKGKLILDRNWNCLSFLSVLSKDVFFFQRKKHREMEKEWILLSISPQNRLPSYFSSTSSINRFSGLCWVHSHAQRERSQHPLLSASLQTLQLNPPLISN